MQSAELEISHLHLYLLVGMRLLSSGILCLRMVGPVPKRMMSVKYLNGELSVTYNRPSTTSVLTPPCANAEMALARNTSAVEGRILTLAGIGDSVWMD
jgi:hypothetical protein